MWYDIPVHINDVCLKYNSCWIPLLISGLKGRAERKATKCWINKSVEVSMFLVLFGYVIDQFENTKS